MINIHDVYRERRVKRASKHTFVDEVVVIAPFIRRLLPGLVRVTVAVELRRAQILSETRERVRSLARSSKFVRLCGERRDVFTSSRTSYRVFVDPGGFLAVGYYLETRRYSHALNRMSTSYSRRKVTASPCLVFNHPPS